MEKIPLCLFIVIGLLRGALLEASSEEAIKLNPQYIELNYIDFNEPDSIPKKNKLSFFYQELKEWGYLYKNRMWYIDSPVAGESDNLQKFLQDRGKITQEDRVRGALERKTSFGISHFLYFVRFDKKSFNLIEQALESHGGKLMGSWDRIEADAPYSLYLRKTERGFYDLFLEDITDAHYEWND